MRYHPMVFCLCIKAKSVEIILSTLKNGHVFVQVIREETRDEPEQKRLNEKLEKQIFANVPRAILRNFTRKSTSSKKKWLKTQPKQKHLLSMATIRPSFDCLFPKWDNSIVQAFANQKETMNNNLIKVNHDTDKTIKTSVGKPRKF